jgi:hypothetical protein
MFRAPLATTLALTLGAVGVSTVVASCFVPGFEVVDIDPVGPSSASQAGAGGLGGAGGAGGMAGTGAQECTHTIPKAQPVTPDAGPDDVDFVAAVRSIDFGEGAKDLDALGPQVGFDLDGRCTCDGEGSSCKLPSGTSEKDHCDGPGGIDNTAAKLFKAAAPFTDNASSADQSKRANEGAWSLLIRIKDYNGKANDAQITASLHPSPGFDHQSCVPRGEPPKWDGSDAWPIDAASLQKGTGPGADGGGGCPGGVKGYTFDKPRYVDTQAFVNDNVFVANLPDAELIFSGATGPTAIHLTAGFITGTIEKGASGYRITNGVLTGRWKLNDMFVSLSSLVSNGVGLCTDSTIYQLLKGPVCNAPDILSALRGPTSPCDAVSFAVGFSTEPAKLGVVWIAETMPPICPDETNPANDSCGAK